MARRAGTRWQNAKSAQTNELQKEDRLNKQHAEQVAPLRKQLATQAAQLTELKELSAVLQRHTSPFQLAMR